jgi:hypothetical protein
VEAAIRADDERALVFDTADVLARVEQLGDLYADNLSLTQQLPHTGTTPR